MDLYCGVGFFGIALASAVDSFVGVECDRMAITAARKNAAARNANNGEFVSATVEEALHAREQVLRRRHERAD